MTTKFVQPGEVIDYTAGANIASGQVVLMGARIGVARDFTGKDSLFLKALMPCDTSSSWHPASIR